MTTMNRFLCGLSIYCILKYLPAHFAITTACKRKRLVLLRISCVAYIAQYHCIEYLFISVQLTIVLLVPILYV